jgi:hypothetical protein
VASTYAKKRRPIVKGGRAMDMHIKLHKPLMESGLLGIFLARVFILKAFGGMI